MASPSPMETRKPLSIRNLNVISPKSVKNDGGKTACGDFLLPVSPTTVLKRRKSSSSPSHDRTEEIENWPVLKKPFKIDENSALGAKVPKKHRDVKAATDIRAPSPSYSKYLHKVQSRCVEVDGAQRPTTTSSVNLFLPTRPSSPKINGISVGDGQICETQHKDLFGQASRTHNRSVSTSSTSQFKIWQRQYRTSFPNFCFYIDGMNDNPTKSMIIKSIKKLGGRVETFFSATVTHVISNRCTKSFASQLEQDPFRSGNREKAQFQTLLPNTEQPISTFTTCRSLNETAVDSTYGSRTFKMTRSQVNSQCPSNDDNNKNSVLQKAKEYNVKIWSVDKTINVLTSLFKSEQWLAKHSFHRNLKSGTENLTDKGKNLAQVLQEEKIYGSKERDLTAVIQDEMYYFKGPFVLVRDLTNMYQPIMVREFKRVEEPQDGEWPQLRSSAPGRCPFLPDSVFNNRKDHTQRPPTNVKVIGDHSSMPVINIRQPLQTLQQAPLIRNLRSNAYISNEHSYNQTTCQTFNLTLCPPLNRHYQAPHDIDASGIVNSSNINSALRNTTSNSTSNVSRPDNGCTVSSKEVRDLKKKLLTTNAMGYHFRDVSNQNIKVVSACHSQFPAPEIQQNRKNHSFSSMKSVKEHHVSKMKPLGDRPGYCENCKSKYDDYKIHAASRSHREYASNDDNFAELDSLLVEICRKRKA